jgi:hypothetical protein
MITLRIYPGMPEIGLTFLSFNKMNRDKRQKKKDEDICTKKKAPATPGASMNQIYFFNG